MKNKALRICAIVFAAYLILGALFYFIAGDSLHFTNMQTSTVSAENCVALTNGSVAEQKFVCTFEELDAISLRLHATGERDGVLTVALKGNGEGTQGEIPLSELPDEESVYTISFDPPIKDALDQEFTITISCFGLDPETDLLIFFGNTVDAGRFDVDTEITDDEVLLIDGVEQRDPSDKPYTLCLETFGKDLHFFGAYYWYFYGGVALLLALYLLFLLRRYKKGKPTLVIGIVQSLAKYSFLIRQLVSRDFKTKYKRSVLGMLWSFLNPLLTMSIQYVVFSTLFKSDIDNFVVYLLTGIVCFNFFNEAANMCLMSIVGNASLINKVYVPKYIYPFSRTLSSSINLLLSLVPLLLMLLITRTPITWAILLLPLVLLMLFMLSYGVGLILATMMVFFRDTQFLWGIFSMLLMYLTPIFYPESIIPSQFMTVYKLNPLYHILRFMRSILIDGVSLEPKAYLYCFALCAIPFLIGVIVFRKNQDKFVLNI